MPEVVVVGGGLAGCWAAATAARGGASVTLLQRAPGATAVSSGAVDFVPPAEATAAAEWLRRLPHTDPGHPYVVDGAAPALDDLVAEVTSLAGALTAAGLPMRATLEWPMLLAAVTGQMRHAGMAQETIAAGDLVAAAGGGAPVAAVGIAGLPRVHAALLASALAVAGVPALPVTVQPALPGIDPDLAEDLDDATVARAVEALGGAEALGAAIAGAVHAATPRPALALLPAVLGLDDSTAVAARTAQAAGLRVAELLTSPPSAPGWRLGGACRRLAAAAGVRLRTAAVTRVVTAPDEVRAVELHDGTIVPCDVFVLATGRYIGGGLSDDRGRLREALLGLPVVAGGRDAATLAPRDLVDRTHFRDQPFNAAGLRLDSSCRPVDGFGRPCFTNLLACGSLLAGIETTLRGGGLGVAAWTAARAGRVAAAMVGSAAA